MALCEAVLGGRVRHSQRGLLPRRFVQLVVQRKLRPRRGSRYHGRHREGGAVLSQRGQRQRSVTVISPACPPWEVGSGTVWWRRCCGTTVRRGSGAPT